MSNDLGVNAHGRDAAKSKKSSPHPHAANSGTSFFQWDEDSFRELVHVEHRATIPRDLGIVDHDRGLWLHLHVVTDHLAMRQR